MSFQLSFKKEFLNETFATDLDDLQPDPQDGEQEQDQVREIPVSQVPGAEMINFIQPPNGYTRYEVHLINPCDILYA